MANSGQSIKDETLREVAFGSITASYASLGSALAADAFRIKVTNNTDVDIYFSWDGTNNHMKIPPFTADLKDNKTNDAFRKSGSQLTIKYGSSAPTQGWASLEVEYV